MSRTISFYCTGTNDCRVILTCNTDKHSFVFKGFLGHTLDNYLWCTVQYLLRVAGTDYHGYVTLL